MVDALLREWQKMLDETEPYAIPLDSQSSSVRVHGVGRCRFGLGTPSSRASIMATTTESRTRTLPEGWVVDTSSRRLICPLTSFGSLEWWPYDRLIVFPRAREKNARFVSLRTEIRDDDGRIRLWERSGRPVTVDFFAPCSNCPTSLVLQTADDPGKSLTVDLTQLFLPTMTTTTTTSIVLGEEFWRNHAWRWSHDDDDDADGRIGLLTRVQR